MSRSSTEFGVIVSARHLAVRVRELHEFSVQITRMSPPASITHGRAVKLMESVIRFSVASTTAELMLAAVATCPRFQRFYRPNR
ncbi:hypothetical protein MSM1_15695 [Mycobacterium sp. SM1]|uniref:hypothetical protein n=1 Tax=Mycobacterium sp. SM1 TaxID=2816243 RepID=UPI001BCCA561|nr:hypothetical protein [Mycobacterium sp. SM1]MBS4729724.1 hypothetical protein [Mycobacterium sp. SM1]